MGRRVTPADPLLFYASVRMGQMRRMLTSFFRGKNLRRVKRARTRWHQLETLEKRNLLTASLSISDATVDEDAGTASFTITLNNPSGSASVDWATSNGTASAGSDYTSSSGTANLSTFNPSVNVSVPITKDSLKESGETFTVNLSNASGATISNGTGLGIINDNDEVELTRVFEKFYEGGELAHAGNVMSAYALPDGTSLIYNSLGNGQLILDLRTVQPDDSTVPSQIKADLTFDGSAVRTIYYSTSGLSAGDGLRFVFDVDVSSLASGVYE